MANTPCPRDGGSLARVDADGVFTWDTAGAYTGASQPVEQTAELLTPLPTGPPTALAVRDAGEELALMIEMGAFTTDVEQAITVIAAAYRDLQTRRDDLLVWLADQERAGFNSVLIDTVQDGLR